eukprot:gene9749-11974_t
MDDQVKLEIMSSVYDEMKSVKDDIIKSLLNNTDTTTAVMDTTSNNHHLPLPPPPLSPNINYNNDNKEEEDNEDEQQQQQQPSYNWNQSVWEEPKEDYYSYSHAKNPTDTYEDEEYFSSYSKISLHHEMVFDKRRTAAYYHAIMNSKELFKDKVVIDVGCGTGILSCFCAMAGAKKVYAVDASDMAFNAELIVQRNGFQNIQVMKGKLETLTFPEYCDIIVSEWMGSFLIFESMLESVIYARDHLLKENGVIFPSKASLYLAPIKVESFYNDKITSWENVFGLDMSPIIPFAKDELLTKSIRNYYMDNENDVLDSPVIIRQIDINTITIQELSKTVLDFKFKIQDGTLNGFGTWFSVYFEGLDNEDSDDNDNNHKEGKEQYTFYTINEKAELVKTKTSIGGSKLSPIGFKLNSNTLELSTAPSTGDTHWKQVLFLMETEKHVKSIALGLGLQRTANFFFQKKKLRGSICFFLGILIVILTRWTFIGLIVEGFGFINLFGDAFPIVIAILRKIPIIGNILNHPTINAWLNKTEAGSELPF